MYLRGKELKEEIIDGHYSYSSYFIVKMIPPFVLGNEREMREVEIVILNLNIFRLAFFCLGILVCVLEIPPKNQRYIY